MEISLIVVHPVDGGKMEIGADSKIMAGELLSQLVEVGFIPSGYNYFLTIEKKDGQAIVCGDKETLEEHKISDQDILRISTNDNISAANHANTVQTQPTDSKASTNRTQQTDSQASTNYEERSGGSILSHNGIDFRQLPMVDLSKWLKEIEEGAPALFGPIVMILHDYQKALEDNRRSEIFRENEREKLCQDKIKLENMVQEYERKSGEKKTAAIVLAAANIVIAFGTAFITSLLVPSIITILAGIMMTVIGLWLSFK